MKYKYHACIALSLVSVAACDVDLGNLDQDSASITVELEPSTPDVDLNVAPLPASVSKSCHTNTNGPSLFGWGEILTKYPFTTSRGTKIHLYSDHANAAVYAKADSVSTGDILSIDRSNFAVSGSGHCYFKQTSWIMAQTPNSGYDYCEWTASSSGSFSTSKLDPIDGAHRYIRVCLRHAGVLECSGWWYGDNDDDWDDTFPGTSSDPCLIN